MYEISQGSRSLLLLSLLKLRIWIVPVSAVVMLTWPWSILFPLTYTYICNLIFLDVNVLVFYFLAVAVLSLLLHKRYVTDWGCWQTLSLKSKSKIKGLLPQWISNRAQLTPHILVKLNTPSSCLSGYRGSKISALTTNSLSTIITECCWAVAAPPAQILCIR